MKKLFIFILLLPLLCPLQRANAQTPEVTQLILNIEKLNQLRKILKELKTGYEILFKGYNTIKDLSEGNFKLHEAFLDGLLQVSPAVRRYKRIADIIEFQLQLVREYKTAFRQFQSGDYFDPDELTYMHKVYGGLIDQSLKSLDALTDILTAKKLRMSDDERLAGIDQIYDEMQDRLVFLRHFNSSTSVLALQRLKEGSDAAVTGKLYDIHP